MPNLTYLEINYVKLERHKTTGSYKTMNKWIIENKKCNYTSIGSLEASLMCIIMKFMYIRQPYHKVSTVL